MVTKPQQWFTLGEYVEKRRSDLLLSRRALARELGMSASHLSGIVQGTIRPGAEICNRLSDYFKDPREIALRLAGWLTEKDSASTAQDEADEQLMREFGLNIRDDPDLRLLYEIYKQQKTPADRRAFVRSIRSDYGKKRAK